MSRTVSLLRFGPLLFVALCCRVYAGEEIYRSANENVNQRYTIESIAVAGVQVDEARLPSRLRQRMTALIGKRCDIAVLEDLASDLRRELHLREVSHHLLRGSQPGQVRVDFDIVRKPVDASVPKFLYHSGQGFTGEAEISSRVGQNNFSVAVVSNGDELTERFSGIAARYENSHLGSDRVRFGLGFEEYHVQWNSETATVAPEADLYSSRRNIAPEFTFSVAKPLTVSVGASFEQTRSDDPAVGLRDANAITAQVNYGHKIEGDLVQQRIDGRYDLRLGTRDLGSDYSYARHMISLRYEVKSGRQSAVDEFTAGALTGNAPMFERFVLGNSSTLRGWNRFAIDPVGADRIVHNSLTYGYQFGERTFEMFYDCGMLWNPGNSANSTRAAQPRHSLGVGYKQGVFILALAFPITDGKVTPVLMAGMNY
ncbi:MAG TPA: BamA/TamA family outer membrane protein [Bryobacteraceae bacterium]|nr:BamA/TamA family outer membrane protein [Bryobacteraceae bacterium]